MLAPALALVVGLQQAAQQGPRTEWLEAESLLAAGRLPQARRIAESLDRSRRDDPQVLVLLGRIHLAWPVIGRYAADSLFARAGRLTPEDPEPFYWRGHVGLALGGDDGEQIARAGLERVLALDPQYRDAWALWSRLYRGDGERRRALAALAAHAGDDAVDLWRGQLLIEQGDWEGAVAVLRPLAWRRRRDPAPHALLAQALYEWDRDVEAEPHYGTAVSLADLDSGLVLWRQIRSVASPAEREQWSALEPGERAAFLRLFWVRREPDLRTPVNERVGEHFRRLAQARTHFTILHPNSRFNRSSLARTVAGGGFTLPRESDLRPLIAEAIASGCAPSLPRADDDRYRAGFSDVFAERESLPNLEDHLDDRGRILVRHGLPDERTVYGLDGETWCYRRPDGVLRVTFLRPRHGEMIVRPVMTGEAASAVELLTTDRPSRAATLDFRFWPATFRRAADGALTELVLFPDSLDGVAVLVDGEGRTVARDSAQRAPLRLVARPGRYLLMLDGRRAERSAYFRSVIALPDYAPDSLAVSGLLVAHGSVAPERAALEAAADGSLRLPADQPMRLFAEVYALAVADGLVRYRASYVLEREERGFLGLGRRRHTSTIDFTREQLAGPHAVETLVIDPGRLPGGRYRVRLEITDLLRGSPTASSTTLTFELR